MASTRQVLDWKTLAPLVWSVPEQPLAGPCLDERNNFDNGKEQSKLAQHTYCCLSSPKVRRALPLCSFHRKLIFLKIAAAGVPSSYYVLSRAEFDSWSLSCSWSLVAVFG